MGSWDNDDDNGRPEDLGFGLGVIIIAMLTAILIPLAMMALEGLFNHLRGTDVQRLAWPARWFFILIGIVLLIKVMISQVYCVGYAVYALVQ